MAITGTAPTSWRPPPGMTPIVAYKVPIDSRHMRVVVDVPVTELVRLLNGQRQVPNGLTLDHVYDY